MVPKDDTDLVAGFERLLDEPKAAVDRFDEPVALHRATDIERKHHRAAEAGA
jgi:hypothetical protein